MLSMPFFIFLNVSRSRMWRSNFLFIIVMGGAYIPSVFSQTTTTIQPKLGTSANSFSLPKDSAIPAFTELRQISLLKLSYDSLKNELGNEMDLSVDSVGRDTVMTRVRDRASQVLEKEVETLQSLISKGDLLGEEILNAANSTLEGVQNSKVELLEIEELFELEYLVDRNDQNLKALTNEWLMPKVEELVAGKVSGIEGVAKVLSVDFYGTDALEQLTRDGVSAGLSINQAKSIAKGKLSHLSDEYVIGMAGKFSKLKFDSLGNATVFHETINKQKINLLEANSIKGISFWQRLGGYIWYDPLTSFGNGLYGDVGVSYHFSQQLEVLGGVVFRRSNLKGDQLKRVGQGAKLGFRFLKGNWFIQSDLFLAKVEISLPGGFDYADFEGKVWSTALGTGRVIPIANRLQSVVIASWDPTFDDGRSLSNSPFQLRIGFELNSLKKDTGNSMVSGKTERNIKASQCLIRMIE
jgi:hypothetical protein